MPRFYVEHEGKWNVFSTIVDDFLFERFMPFAELRERFVREHTEDLLYRFDSLLTDTPELNVMTYREAIVTRTIREASEQWEGDDHEFDTGFNELHRKWDESGAPPEVFVQAVRAWLEKSRRGFHVPHHDSAR